ncbi:MAG: ABC transporter permease, partial [Clostridia bacterium]|nr:ABC transporter permease [Clostridia bacterium]
GVSTVFPIFFFAIAALLSVVTMLVPVYRAAKVEIVQYKQRTAGRALLSSALLRQILLGVLTALLLLVAFYAHYVLVRQQDGILTSSGKIQPLAYLFLICFFTSAALFFILIYPFFIRLIRRIGRQKWSAGAYLALSRIARMETKEKFIVVFLTVTIALGVFSGISARTMNRNMSNTVRYQYPCDIIADVNFYDTSIRVENQNGLPLYRSTPRPYFYDQLDQTQATKVVKGLDPSVNSRYHTSVQSNLSMMAIDPDEFGAIVYWDDSILPKPLSDYLQMLKDNPESCILSRNMANALGVSIGDFLYVRPSGEGMPSDVVYSSVAAIIDAWPTYYAQTDTAQGYAKNNYLLIINRAAVEKVDDNLPYQVWMNTKHSIAELKSFTITASAKYQTVDPETGKDVRVYARGRLANIVNGAREVYLSEINAVRQGTNGSLTLGFLAVMLICAIGFILYWVISIQNRTLQIGTMRALGVSIKEIHRMILLEQFLLCVASVILGVAAGILSGVLFAPLLRSAFTDMGAMPPYQLVISFADIVKLLACVFVLLLFGHGMALLMLKRIRAAAAIKLGEE